MLRPNILIVDDDKELLGVAATALEPLGNVVQAQTCDEAIHELTSGTVDSAVVDLHFEGQEKDGIFLLDYISKHHRDVPVIVLSGDKTTSRVVAATKFHYIDFIPKEGSFYRILGNAVKVALAQRESNVACDSRSIFETRSPAMRELLDQVKQIVNSPIESPILILGESGTGKEVMATHIAQLLGKHIVPVNMAGIPKDLAEAELYGVAEGAYTGATRSRDGMFQRARNGILFLDELGDCPLDLQAKLLRTIQEKEVKAVGSNKIQTTNVRFLAATNKNLGEMVSEGLFREDLLARLSTFVLRLPPLRDRREDIVYLAEKFLSSATEKRFFLSASAIEALVDYDWPLNVRELKSTVERMITVSPSKEIDGETVRKCFSNMADPIRKSTLFPPRDELSRILEQFAGNRVQVAQHYRVTRTTIIRWMDIYNLRNQFHGRSGRPALVNSRNGGASGQW